MVFVRLAFILLYMLQFIWTEMNRARQLAALNKVLCRVIK